MLRPPSKLFTDAFRRRVEERFTRNYYEDPGTWRQTFWQGVPTAKCPLDLWIYQEIIFETRPELIVETGTFKGGSALFLASICNLLGRGEVITVDLEELAGRPIHPRLTYLTGSSTDPQVVSEIKRRAAAVERVMLVLDSDHSEAHVSEELRELSSVVTPGCYLVVEDTNVNGHPVARDFGPGPAEAVHRFLSEEPAMFEVDRAREKFHLTFNPGGYLKRVR